jgi:hypothetical protein
MRKCNYGPALDGIFRTFRFRKFRKLQKTRSDLKTDSKVLLKVRNAGPETMPIAKA